MDPVTHYASHYIKMTPDALRNMIETAPAMAAFDAKLVPPDWQTRVAGARKALAELEAGR